MSFIRKRIKKEYPPGTFIPMRQRICAIIQLCLAFMIILWNISYPFMGELFSYKSQMLLYKDVMGISTIGDSTEKQERLAHNAQRFHELPNSQKSTLADHYHELQKLSQRTFIDKLERSIQIVFFELSFYKKMWLLLSLVLPILLLKRVEGARQAIWLLPLLTTIYAFDNYRYAAPPALSAEARLFPTEQTLVEHYLKKPLSPVIAEQQQQLLFAWKLYLIQEWVAEDVKKQNNDVDNLAEEGEFAFNLARIQTLPAPLKLIESDFNSSRKSLWILAAYLFWNFFFAFTVWKGEDSLCALQSYTKRKN